MRQAVAEMIGITRGENLRLGFEAAKSPRMNDPVAISGVIAAVSMCRLWKTTPAGVFRTHGPGGWCANCGDGPLHLVKELSRGIDAPEFGTAAKSSPGRGPLDRRCSYPGILF